MRKVNLKDLLQNPNTSAFQLYRHGGQAWIIEMQSDNQDELIQRAAFSSINTLAVYGVGTKAESRPSMVVVNGVWYVIHKQ